MSIPFVLRNAWLSLRSEINLSRFGIQLSVDNRTLTLLMGFLLLLSSIYLLYQHVQADFQNERKTLEEKTHVAEMTKDDFVRAAQDLRDIWESFGLEMNIRFPDEIDRAFLSNNNNKGFLNDVSVTLTVRHAGEGSPRTFDSKELTQGKGGFRVIRNRNGILLTGSKLRKDDHLTIVAKHGGRSWTGELLFPRADIQLTEGGR
jgi:hypothetical protein